MTTLQEKQEEMRLRNSKVGLRRYGPVRGVPTHSQQDNFVMRPDICDTDIILSDKVLEGRREYFNCPLPSSYGALKCIEDALKEYDRESYEFLVSRESYEDVKIGNPTKEVYGDAYKPYVNATAKERLTSSVQARLKQTLYSRIAAAMRNLRARRNNPDLIKAGSSVKDLGCTLEFLEKHIEGKFQEGMTWDNYGEWEVDHIYPLSKLDLANREDFCKACHYSNLQPLWWQDNLRKHARVLD